MTSSHVIDYFVITAADLTAILIAWLSGRGWIERKAEQISKINWQLSGNLYWLSSDLMWTWMQVNAGNVPRMNHGLKKAVHHATALKVGDPSHRDWWCYRCGDARGVAVCPICGLKAPAGYANPGATLSEVYSSLEEIKTTSRDELERVNTTLKQIQSTVASRPRDVWSLFWFIVIIFFLASWPGSQWDRWTDKAWYSVRYDTEFMNIAVENRPADCDFMHAPLGDKGCAYKKHVTARQGATNS